ncbi:glycine--tRNA ligase subunit alpha, partial [bacterium]|nr:glycine--tRNA ligase subunit alpha [bacterium]
LERIAMFLQGVKSMFDITWGEINGQSISYGELFHDNEVQWSKYNFKASDAEYLFAAFNSAEKETRRLIDVNLVLPAYDQLVKSSHLFNLLDARGSISVTERVGYVTRLRNLAKLVAQGHIQRREELGFPLKKDYTG